MSNILTLLLIVTIYNHPEPYFIFFFNLTLLEDNQENLKKILSSVADPSPDCGLRIRIFQNHNPDLYQQAQNIIGSDCYLSHSSF